MTSTSSSSSYLIPQQFVQTLEELLRGLHEVFPECEKVKKQLLKFQTFVKSADQVDEKNTVIQTGVIKPMMGEHIVRDWHAKMNPYYDLVTNRRVEELFASNMPALDDLDIRQKWADPEFGQDSKQSLLQYIDTLNMYARLYCAVPPTLFAKLDVIHQNVMKQGEMPSISDLFQQVSNMMSDMSPEELQHLAQSTDLQSLAPMLTSMTGMNMNSSSMMDLLKKIM